MGVGLSGYQAVELGPPLLVDIKVSAICKRNKSALLIIIESANSVAKGITAGLLSCAVTCSASSPRPLLSFGHPALVQTHYT
jgi:hypothetical protein